KVGFQLECFAIFFYSAFVILDCFIILRLELVCPIRIWSCLKHPEGGQIGKDLVVLGEPIKFFSRLIILPSQGLDLMLIPLKLFCYFPSARRSVQKHNRTIDE